MKYNFEHRGLQNYFDQLAKSRNQWIDKNKFYYQELFILHRWLIKKNAAVLDIGCATGQLLDAVSPKKGTGIDFSFEMIKIAGKNYPQYDFKLQDAQNLQISEKFDYVLMSNLVGYVADIWQLFRSSRIVMGKNSRLIITNYNYLWQPILSLAEKLHLKMPDKIQNWLPQEFIIHFLYLNGYEVIKKGKTLHLPIYIPIVSQVVNRILANIPVINDLALIEYLVARPVFLNDQPVKSVGVSVIVPTHEEAGNIETIVARMIEIGKFTELIFVDLPGKDDTHLKIKQAIKNYSGPITVKYVNQPKKTGKIGALRLGVKAAKGEIIMIYDADVTIPPEDLIKFYLALVENKADLVNGTRLVYPTETGAMRFLNHMANAFFAQLFTWALGQHFTDTLCGTKAFWKKDFAGLEKTRDTTHALDKFGDFYLLLGAYKKHLKIAEVPVRYKTRRYGDTKINRFKNGWTFLQIFLYFFWYYKLLRNTDEK